MFKKPYNKYSSRGATFALLEKRNKQFSLLFKRLRDPVVILEIIVALNPVYKKYFDDIRNASRWLKVLDYLYYQKEYIHTDGFQSIFGFTKAETSVLVRRMLSRDMLKVNKTHLSLAYMYSLSPEGHLLLKNFSKECMSAIMKVVREGRKAQEVKNKYYEQYKKRWAKGQKAKSAK